MEPAPFSIKTDHALFTQLHLPDHNQMLIGNQIGELHVIDLTSKQEVRNWKAHEKGLFHLLYHEQLQRVYSLGGNGDLIAWQWPEQTLLKQQKIGYGKLRQAALSPDGGMIAVSCQDGFIRIYESEELEELYSFHAHDNGAHALLFHPTLHRLYSGGKDAHLKTWNVSNGFSPIFFIPAHNYGIYALALSGDQTTLASGSRDATIKLWDAASPDIPIRISRPAYEAHTHSVNALLWQGNRLISAGDDRRIIAWDIDRV